MMKKRILASLLALVMVISMVPVALAIEDLAPAEMPTPTDTTAEGDPWISGLANSAEIPTNLNNHNYTKRVTLPVSDCPIRYDDMVENNLDLTSGLGTTFELSNDNYDKVMQEAANHVDTNVVLVLTEALTLTNGFAGIPGKSVTVTSQGSQSFSLSLATDLVGDITLDHVRILEGTVFANGHRFETTESVSGSIQCL